MRLCNRRFGRTAAALAHDTKPISKDPDYSYLVDKWDLCSVLAALAIVAVVAVVFGPAPEAVPVSPVAAPAETPVPTTPSSGDSGFVPLPAATASPGPYRIVYETDYRKYPRYYLPSNLSSFGGSDIPWKTDHTVPFAYVEGSDGGVTETFTVPSPVWRMNCTVSAERRPQAALFRMALIDAETGGIVEGAELRYPGSIIKNVQSGDGTYYLIIGCDYVDRYVISLETFPADAAGA